MPHYDYLCTNCETEFELFHSILDDSSKNCPNCNSNNLQKLISGGGAVIIKGTSTPCYQSGINKEKKQKKVLGQGEQNTPPWRSSKDGKVRKDILKNPSKYIENGEV